MTDKEIKGGPTQADENIDSILRHAKAFGAGAINPFSITANLLDVAGYPGGAKSIRDAELGSPIAATAGSAAAMPFALGARGGLTLAEMIKGSALLAGAGGHAGAMLYPDNASPDPGRLTIDRLLHGSSGADASAKSPFHHVAPPTARTSPPSSMAGRPLAGWGAYKEAREEGRIPKTPMTYPDSDQNMNPLGFDLNNPTWEKWVK